MPIQIHDKTYITVAERVKEAHKELKTINITTEVLFQSPVVVKATVLTPKGTFTGISAANPSKTIEKTSPYEVAETSAVGRALGFAGYGIVEGIASADEVVKAIQQPVQSQAEQRIITGVNNGTLCVLHNKPMKQRTGKDGNTWFDHRWQVNGEWKQCSGKVKEQKAEEVITAEDYPDFNY